VRSQLICLFNNRRKWSEPQNRQGAGQEIRDQIAVWADGVLGNVIDAWPEMPNGVQDRDADVWEVLLAVADVAGGKWPELARTTALALVTEAKERSPSLGVRLLSDLRDLFGADAKALRTDDILKELCKLDEAPWGISRASP
jgi:hypothetical protein